VVFQAAALCARPHQLVRDLGRCPGTSLTMILRSMSSGGKSKLIAMKRCLVEGLRSFSTVCSRVVRDHQHEILVGLDFEPPLLDGELAPVVGERMDDHGRIVRASTILVSSRSRRPSRARERPVLPHGFCAFEEKAADKSELVRSSWHDTVTSAVSAGTP